MSHSIISSCRALVRLTALVWIMLTATAAFRMSPMHRCDLFARARWLQHTCRRALKALAIAPRFSGHPAGGRIVTANHLGYLDILVLAAAAPTVFVAKREVQSWPIFGWFARAAGTRFIDREKRSDVVRVAAELTPALAAGVNLVLFLEGTSTPGEHVQPFKASLLEPAARHGWAIVPAALAYRVPEGHSAADEVCWWGDMTLPPHLWHLAGLREITVDLAWGRPLAPNSDRKELARAAHSAVVALHAGLHENAPPASPASLPVLVEQVI